MSAPELEAAELVLDRLGISPDARYAGLRVRPVDGTHDERASGAGERSAMILACQSTSI